MFAQGWMVPLLGIVSLLAVVAVVYLMRVWPRKPELSPEELAEIGDAPMPTMQKRAIWGFVIGMAAFAIIAAILSAKGAMAYWEDDNLRLQVLGIFMIGLLGSVGVTHLPLIHRRARRQLDERDRTVLSHAPAAQTALVVLGLAAWVVTLAQRFQDHENQRRAEQSPAIGGPQAHEQDPARARPGHLEPPQQLRPAERQETPLQIADRFSIDTGSKEKN